MQAQGPVQLLPLYTAGVLELQVQTPAFQALGVPQGREEVAY